MASFFSMDPKHICRLLGAVAGMDTELKSKGMNPEELRSEFWERFGSKSKKIISANNKGLRFDPDERVEYTQDCGSCGGIDICQYEIVNKEGKFYIDKYVKGISTHMGSELEKEEELEFEFDSSEPLDFIRFISEHGATIVSLADIFDWVDIIKAVKESV